MTEIKIIRPSRETRPTPGALRLRRATALLAAAFLLVGSPGPARAAGSQPLASHLPPSAKTARSLGRLEPSTRLSLTLGLPLRHQTELNQLITDLFAPSSPRYHHFLSSAEFTGRFGPAEADYQKLANFAGTNGLSVDRLHPNRTLLGISGKAADLERVFHVTLRRYQHPHEAREFFAPDSAPSIDLDLPILDVTGLDNYSIPKRSSASRTFKAKPSGSTPAGLGAASVTAGTYTGPNGSGPYSLYMGSDFRHAYAPGVALTGVGQTVGLFEAGGYNPADISAYESMAGLPQVPLTNVLLDNATGLVNTDIEIEVAGDIEMVVAMAPGLSQVIVYQAPGAFDQPFEILNRVATDDLAKQISCSYIGFPESPLLDQVFRQFVVQGQSFFTASGDNLAYYAGNPPLAPDDSPYVTVVGGTALTTTTHGGAWSGESVWNTGGGSGGGVSVTYPIPSWQQNVNMSFNQGSTTMRNLPDVAAVATDIFGFIGGSATGIGGTSFATPLWAGLAALANQQAAENGGPPVGFLNPALYALAGGPGYENYFHDITTGNNTDIGSPNAYFAVPGYDLCTGWGSPGGRALLDALAPHDALRFSPENGLAFGGLIGGPFTPSPQALYLTNAGHTSLSWSLSNSAPWLQISATAGSLAAGSPAVALAVSLAPAATNLPAGHYLAWIAVENLGDGVVLNIPVTLTIASSSADFYPPVITNQPSSQFTSLGVPAAFTVGAAGSPPLLFQWRLNNTNLADGPNITGSSSGILLIANVSASNLGAYSVVVSNLAGATVSASASLAFAQAPIITGQPVSQSVPAGSPVAFSVSAVGGQPLSWQWSLNGTPLPNGANVSGASSNTLVLLSVSTNLAGTYSVVISNSFGAVTSASATLSLSPPYFPGASLTPLYTFSGGVDGRNPNGSLLLAPDGAFYGVTEFGGANDYGEIFRLTTAGRLSVLHSFTNDDNGYFPLAGLALGNDGALYGTTSEGGSDGSGAVFRFTIQGVLTTLHAFAGGNEGASPSASLTLAPDGGFYGVTSAGGPDGDGTVFHLTPNGVLTTLHSFAGGDGANPTGALAPAADGSFYGMTTSGGGTNAGTIFRITPAGQFSLVYSFSGGKDGSSPLSSLVPAPDGGFYGCAPNGGPFKAADPNGVGYGTVFEVYTNGSFHLIYAFTDGDDGSTPENLLLAPDGSLFGATLLGGPTEATDPSGDGYGTLFNLNTNGLLSIVASFGGDVGTFPFAPLVFGPEGQIYGTTQGSFFGATNVGSVFRLNLQVGSTNAPPLIAVQPAGQTLPLGSSAVFAVDALGGGTLSYQWSQNGTNLLDSAAISGSSSNILTLLDISAADAGTYSVLVSNMAGSVASSNALLTVVTVPPTISVQPASQSLRAGAPAVFAVTAAGSSPLSFQWLKNGASFSPGPGVSGVSGDALTLPNVSGADAGAYAVIVSNAAGSVTSSNALLTVSSDNSTGVVLQTLFSFTDGNPSGLVRGPDGAIYGVTANGGPNLAGTLFRVTDTTAPTLLHTFTGGADGANPSGRLVIGADGNIYGVTTSGGTNGGWGTVFQASLDGTITTLHSFSATDGSQPFGALVQYTDGDLYGTTSYGGAYGFGTLFKITTNGLFSSLYSFGGFSGDGAVPLAGLVPGPGGVLYGTTSDGGAYQTGEIFKLGADGAPSSVFSFGGANGYNSMDLTPGPDGALYGVCIYGGPDFSFGTTSNGDPEGVAGDGLVFSLGTDGALTTIPFAGGNGANPKAALVLGPDGNFYGTTAHGDVGYGTVFRCNFTPAPGGATLFRFNGANGANPESALVLGTNGDFYGTTFYGGANGQGTIFHLTIGAPAPPNFLTFSANQGLVSFSWSAMAGEVYQVQFKSDLSQTNWNILTTLSAAGPTASATDSPGAANRFYRVVLLQ